MSTMQDVIFSVYWIHHKMQLYWTRSSSVLHILYFCWGQSNSF